MYYMVFPFLSENLLKQWEKLYVYKNLDIKNLEVTDLMCLKYC